MSTSVVTAVRALVESISRWEPSLAGRLSLMAMPETMGMIQTTGIDGLRAGLEQLDALHAVTTGEIVAPNAMPLGV